MSGSKNSPTPGPEASGERIKGPEMTTDLARSIDRSLDRVSTDQLEVWIKEAREWIACRPYPDGPFCIDTVIRAFLLGRGRGAMEVAEGTTPTVRQAAQAAVAAYDKGDDVWGGIDQLRRALIEEPMPRVPEALVVKARLTPELEAMIREHLKRPVPRLGMIPNAMEISLVDHASERGVEPALGGPPRFYDSLRAVLGRPDVAEAFAKGLCAHNGGHWEAATEAGRNAFREEAGHLIEEALAAPRVSKPPAAHEPTGFRARCVYCPGCAVPVGERVNLPKGWRESDPLPANLTIHRDDDGTRFAFRGHQMRQDRVPLDPPSERCPDCDRTVFVGNPPAMGFIAECGRRITTLAECGVKTCPVVTE